MTSRKVNFIHIQLAAVVLLYRIISRPTRHTPFVKSYSSTRNESPAFCLLRWMIAFCSWQHLSCSLLKHFSDVVPLHSWQISGKTYIYYSRANSLMLNWYVKDNIALNGWYQSGFKPSTYTLLKTFFKYANILINFINSNNAPIVISSSS